MDESPNEKYFKAEPLRTENSWRVIGARGELMAFRLDRVGAENLAAELNDKRLLEINNEED